MSKRKKPSRLTYRSDERSKSVRERFLQVLARRWKLDRITQEVLRGVVAQGSVRESLPDRFSLQLPSEITLEQQKRIASPLLKHSPEYATTIMEKLSQIGGAGPRMAQMVRISLLNPLVALESGSTFEGYMIVCRYNGLHPKLLRALRHLRDAITVTVERYFSAPSQRHVSWALHRERVTAAMLKDAEACLREVDLQSLDAPASKKWLGGIHRAFWDIKSGKFRLPDRSHTVPAARNSQVFTGSAETETLMTPPETSPTAYEHLDERTAEERALDDGLHSFRQHLMPQYLDLAANDFDAICKADRDAVDFARRLAKAIEAFSLNCLEAVRSRHVDTWAAQVAACNASMENVDTAVGDCLRQLAVQAASYGDWLRRELPLGEKSAENSLGSRMLALAERSLLAGLFLLFLQQRFAELFREISPRDAEHLQQRAEAGSLLAIRLEAFAQIRESLAKHRSAPPDAVSDVAKICDDAMASLAPLMEFAMRGKYPEVRETAAKLGKIRQRFLSSECFGSGNESPGSMQILEYHPAAVPPLTFLHRECTEESGMHYRQVQICRFSRHGVDLSSDIAIPISALFGEESSLARAAGYLGSEADRHLFDLQRVIRSDNLRPCLAYIEREGAILARIHLGAKDADDGLTLLALPTPALGVAEGFRDKFSFEEAGEQFREEFSSSESLLAAVGAYCRERGIATDDYSLSVFNDSAPVQEAELPVDDEELEARRRVRRFLNQKNRWPLTEAERILAALGIVIEAKSDGAPHGKVRLGERHHTLSSKLLKNGEMYATFLYEWIYTLGQDRLLAELLAKKDPRLAPYMRRADAAQE